MSKRKSKTGKQNSSLEKPKTRVQSSDEKGADTDGQKKMDFGGLPGRDLKKNLGCGG